MERRKDRKERFEMAKLRSFFSFFFSFFFYLSLSFSTIRPRTYTIRHDTIRYDERYAEQSLVVHRDDMIFLTNRLYSNNRCSSADEDCDDPSTKAVREKERRQANNVRERLVNTRSKHSQSCLLYPKYLDIILPSIYYGTGPRTPALYPLV